MLDKKAEAQSKSQQRFMGMVYAYKDGSLDTSKLPKELIQKIKRASSSMTKAEVDDFASTRHKGLPEKKASMNKYIQQGFTAGIIKEALTKAERAMFKSYKELHTKGVRQDIIPKIIANTMGTEKTTVQNVIQNKKFLGRVTLLNKAQGAGKYMKSVGKAIHVAAKKKPGTTLAVGYIIGRAVSRPKKKK